MAQQCPDCDAWVSSNETKCQCGFVFVVVDTRAKSKPNPTLDKLMRQEMQRLELDQPRPGESREQFVTRCRDMFAACKDKDILKRLKP